MSTFSSIVVFATHSSRILSTSNISTCRHCQSLWALKTTIALQIQQDAVPSSTFDIHRLVERKCICGRHSLRPCWRRSQSASSFDSIPFVSLLVHMVIPASTQLHHGAACNIVSPVRLRRFNSVVPLRPCSTRPHCRATSKHSLPICQAQAAAVAEQSAPSSPAKRPRSPAKKGRKKASNTEDDTVDTGEPGKRVVIVGGGWAGKSGQFQTLCRHAPVFIRQP